MRLFLTILGIIWTSPAIILVWLLYIIPLIVFRSIWFRSWYNYTPVFQLVNDDSWYAKLWRDWYGWSGPWVILIKDLPGPEDGRCVSRTLSHEYRHWVQQMILGLLFYLVYILNSIYVWLFCKDKHAYLDNFFERDARKVAGQHVDIPRGMWPHGSRDRWPWW
jgi:hypothetical protein